MLMKDSIEADQRTASLIDETTRLFDDYDRR